MIKDKTDYRVLLKPKLRLTLSTSTGLQVLLEVLS